MSKVPGWVSGPAQTWGPEVPLAQRTTCHISRRSLPQGGPSRRAPCQQLKHQPVFTYACIMPGSTQIESICDPVTTLEMLRERKLQGWPCRGPGRRLEAGRVSVLAGLPP